MVKFKVLTGILCFLTLITSLLLAFFTSFWCFKCKETYLYAQLGQNVDYGFVIVIFVVCISIMAKEEIPRRMQMFIHFSSAIGYVLLSTELFLDLSNFTLVAKILIPGTGVLTCLLHLCLGLLFAFKEKIQPE